MIDDPAFDLAIKFVLPHEEEFARGHWGDDSQEAFVATEHDGNDPGGVTRYGIDAASHPGIDIANLTRAGAIDIYADLWRDHNLDLLPSELAICAFDVWVNGGHANVWLQHAFNAAGGQPPLVEDGNLGPKSVAAFQNATVDQIADMVMSFLSQRDARFKVLAAGSSRLATFLKGWEQRDSDLRAYLLS